MQVKRLLVTLTIGIGLSLALLWLLGGGLRVANAESFTVTTGNDENNGGCPGPSCSLREAIIAANDNNEADTISLPAGIFTLTIAGADEDASATGDLDITSTLALTITGAGPSQTIINANGLDRVFHIHTGTVVISGVTIFNGIVTGYGGGIQGSDVDLVLINTVVHSNSASIGGGGVCVGWSIATLNMSGGQIYNNSAAYGGGVYVEGGSATLNGTQVHGNFGAFGGGVSVYEGNVTLSGVQVYDNLASYAPSYGGGVYVEGVFATLNMSASQIYSNSAVFGGGMSVYEGSATLSGTQVYGNSASNNGGGASVWSDSAALNASGGEFHSNLTNGHGGGVAVGYGRVTLYRTRVYGNAAHTGGGMSVWHSSATLSLSETQVYDNSASDYGGGIHVNWASATLSETQVYGNLASSSGGGGVSVGQDSATLRVSGGQVYSNSAADGGGIYANGNTTLNGTRVYGNSSIAESGSDGGGVYVAGGIVMLSEAQVYGNSSAATASFSGDGGGVCVDGGLVTLSETRVYANSATVGGGGVYVRGGSMALNRTQVRDNSATYGGGMYVYGGSATLSETQVYGNTSTDGNALYNLGIITPTTSLTVAGDVYQGGGTFAGSSHDLHIEGSLHMAGGDLYAPENVQLTGSFIHNGGTYRQTQSVNGNSNISFPKNGGVILNANGQDLGRTEVQITAGVNCAGVSVGEAVAHCAVITPTTATGRDATITFFYTDGEIPWGHSCAAVEAYRWDGTWDHRLTRDGGYDIDGRMCGNDPQSIQVTNVTEFSPFVLSGPSSEIIVLPAGLNFGHQDVDAGPTASQPVVIDNDGMLDLHVSSISLTGSDAAEFTIASGGGAVTLTTGSTHTIRVSFDPSIAGIKSANLTIQSDDPDEGTVNVALGGTGTSSTGHNPPSFTSTPVEAGIVGEYYTYDITATDLDAGDTLAFTAPVLDTWLVLTQLTAHTARLRGTPILAGDYPVALKVTDGLFTDTQVFTITVAESAMPVLQVNKKVDTSNHATVPPGSVVTYTITIHNIGGHIASNVMITDPLPSAVTFGNWVGWGGSAVLPPPEAENLPAVTVTWSPGNLAASTMFTLSFTAHVVTDTQFAGQMIENTARVVAGNADPNESSASFVIESGASYIYLPVVTRNH